jgi:5-(carboxyamino)imidazole ribonucleotide synthase
MPNDVADLDPALAKLVAVLPNKVGLDKKSSPVDNKSAAVDAPINAETKAEKTLEDTDVSAEGRQTEKPVKATVNKAKK